MQNFFSNFLFCIVLGVTEPLGGENENGIVGGAQPAGESAPSLARIVLNMESAAAKQAALQHILNTLQVSFYFVLICLLSEKTNLMKVLCVFEILIFI